MLTPDATATPTPAERRRRERDPTPTGTPTRRPTATATQTPAASPEAAQSVIAEQARGVIAPRTAPVPALFSNGLLRAPNPRSEEDLEALADEIRELPMRGTSPAPPFSAFAAALPRPDPPTWPRNPPPIEAADLDRFLAERGSPMAGLGEVFLDVGWRYNVDPRLLVAIAGADTGFGAVLCTDFNAWNWFWFEWCNSPFESWRQALDEVARGLRIHYLNQGLTDVDSIASRYGPLDDPRDTLGLNRHWPGNVIRYLEALGGSRCNLGWVQTDRPCPQRRVDAAPADEETPPEEDEEGGEVAAEEAEEGPAPEEEPLALVPGMEAVAGLPEPFTMPTRAPTAVASVRAAAPAPAVETRPPPRGIAAPPPPAIPPRPTRSAAPSVAEPPLWSHVVVFLVGLAIVAGRTFGTCAPRIGDPRQSAPWRWALRIAPAPAKLAEKTDETVL